MPHTGAVAGALSIATTQPLDTVRIRMQSAQVATVSGTATLTKPVPDMLACMVRKEGLMSPFRGMSFPLAFTSLQVSRLALGWQPPVVPRCTRCYLVLIGQAWRMRASYQLGCFELLWP